MNVGKTIGENTILTLLRKVRGHERDYVGQIQGHRAREFAGLSPCSLHRLSV